VGQISDGPGDETRETTARGSSRAGPPGAISGTWTSEVRDTAWGPLRFEFRFGAGSEFSVTGTPVIPSDVDRYERTGPYRLEGDRLTTPALNEGHAVRFSFKDEQLRLSIGDVLEFQLRKR
jgi:hypothetical protein